jgi:hypothetical protein
MKEQRRFARRNLHSNVSVFEETSEKCLGTMLDFSEGGVLVSSYQPFTVGQVVKLSMVDLPNNIGRKRTGHIEVESVRCDPFNGTMYGIGFKLISADERAKDMFTSYDDGHAPK